MVYVYAVRHMRCPVHGLLSGGVRQSDPRQVQPCGAVPGVLSHEYDRPLHVCVVCDVTDTFSLLDMQIGFPVWKSQSGIVNCVEALRFFCGTRIHKI